VSSNSTRTADRRVTYRRVKGSPWPAIVFEDRPTCHDCGAPFEPICPTYKCPARKTVLSMMHAESSPEPTKYAGLTPESGGEVWGAITETESRRQHVGEVRRPKGAKRPKAPSKRDRVMAAKLGELAARYGSAA
jgi:hypothetical protein